MPHCSFAAFGPAGRVIGVKAWGGLSLIGADSYWGQARPALARRSPRNARRHFKAMTILHGPIELSWSPDGLIEKT